MYLIEVIPLSRLPRSLPDVFSYFTPLLIEPGTAVEMRVQNRKLVGIVLRSSLVKDAKQALRSAPYALKKIERVISSHPIFNQRDFAFFSKFTEHYITSPGAILKLFLPSFIAKPKVLASLPKREVSPEPAASSTEVIIGIKHLPHYVKAVESALKDQRQALIITPEIVLAQNLHGLLKEQSLPTALVTSRLPDKELKAAWLGAYAGKPLAIIGTHMALFLPFTDLGLIIIDDDGSPYHKSWDQEPRYHNRTVAEMLKTFYGSRLILGGAPPSLDAYGKTKDPSAPALLSLLPDEEHPPLSFFVDMQKEGKERGEFTVISQVVKDKLRTVLANNGRAFLFVNRKGFAPFILCQECGEAFLCANCSVPLVYHAQESLSLPTLLCHHCSAKQPAPDICARCGSHRLKAYGIGVQRVIRELKKLFPQTPIIGVDADEQARIVESISSRLEKTPSYIAVGTEYAVSGLALPKGELAAIISIDTALRLPDFMQNERLFRILTLVRRLAGKHFILQSFSKEPELLYDLFHGTFGHFAEKELKERRKFAYPPFGELIKLTVRERGREPALARVKKLRLALDSLERQAPPGTVEVTNPYPAYVEKKKGRFIFHILIKIVNKQESSTIKQILRAIVPPEVIIDVGPNTLL